MLVCMRGRLAPPQWIQDTYRRFLIEEAMSVLRHDVRNKLGAIRNASFYLQRKVERAAPALWSEDPRMPKFFELIGSELTAAEKTLASKLPSLSEAGGGATPVLAAVRRVLADAGLA